MKADIVVVIVVIEWIFYSKDVSEHHIYIFFNNFQLKFFL